MVKNIHSTLPIKDSKPIQNTQANPALKPQGPSFNAILDKAVETSKVRNDKMSVGLSFSKHALDRLKDRHIAMDINKMEKLDGAIAKAAKKGSKESLIISDNTAFIVNVPKKKVITALDKAQMQENVFTNIDSTVIA